MWNSDPGSQLNRLADGCVSPPAGVAVLPGVVAKFVRATKPELVNIFTALKRVGFLDGFSFRSALCNTHTALTVWLNNH